MGVNGAERGEGVFFDVPKCALLPQYGRIYQDARVNFYCILLYLFFFLFPLVSGHMIV